MLKQQEFETGFVLHRRPYRETSMIIDFFTLRSGRISAVVKGVRQSKSDKKSVLQPFQALQFKLSGKSELKTLATAEQIAATIPLRGDALYCGFYMNEVITRVLPQGLSCEDFYQRYLSCLENLADNKPFDITLRHFEFGLLDELGVLPDLTQTHSGEQIVVTGAYIFQADIGLTPSAPGKQTFSGQSLLDITQQNWNSGSRRAAKNLCRLALQPFLGTKPLHSRALFSGP